jgi:hypothetical protein
MFESCWKRERTSPKKIAAVAALTVLAFGAQAALFAGAIARPLQGAMAGIQTLPAHAPTRDDLPEATEEIVVVAPYRPVRAANHARVGPWRTDARRSQAIAAAEWIGYCPAEP